jgi:hypothetical protein
LDVECKQCGAQLRVEAALRTVACPYCASSSVVQRPGAPGRPAPTFALGFSVAQRAAQERASRWLRRRSPFCPSAIKRAKVEALQGIYLPAYLYSAAARTEYQAEIGEDYQERYTVVVNGKAQVRIRTCTEWTTLRGCREEYVADVLVTASKGLTNAELEHLEPFDLRLLHRYQPEIVSGWIAEEPSRGPDECAELARAEAQRALERRVRAFLPGDRQQNLSCRTALGQESLELCLVPIWVLAVRYAADRPALKLLVNGQSGEVYGRAPLSAAKITAAVGLALALLGLLALLLGGRA